MLRNSAGQVIEFAPRDEAGALVQGCGATLVLYVAKDGGTLTAAGGTLSEKLVGAAETGLLKYLPTQAETNANVVTLYWTDETAIADYLSIETNPGWTALLATYLGYLFPFTGVITDAAPTAGAFAVTMTPDQDPDGIILMTSGVCLGQPRQPTRCLDNSPANVTKSLTFDYPFPAAPANGDTFVVLAIPNALNVGSLTLGATQDIADAVSDAIGPGTGENTVPITVTDGMDPLNGARVSIRATAGGASLVQVMTDTEGHATANLDDGTYYMQAALRGYVHAEEEVEISTNPQAVTLAMAGLTVEAPSDPALVKVYLVQRTAGGAFAAGRPFTMRLNTPCLDAAGEVVADVVTSEDDLVNGYAWAEVYPTDDLTRQDGGSGAIEYVVRTAGGAAVENIEVLAEGGSVQDLSELLHG